MDELECPHCGHKYIPDDYGLLNTNEPIDEECPNCEKEFKYQWYVEPYFDVIEE